VISTANLTIQFGPKPLFENVSVKFGKTCVIIIFIHS